MHKQAHANPYVAYLSFGKECENNESVEDEDVISSPFMSVSKHPDAQRLRRQKYILRGKRN